MASLAPPASRDTIALSQPVALQFRDASDLSLVTDGIDVTVRDARHPPPGRPLRVVPSGWWTAQRLAGYSGWPSDRDRALVVEVRDRAGRYHPASFTLDIGKAPPAERPLAPVAISPWPKWSGFNPSRTRPIRPVGAPDGFQPGYIPLFPTVARSAPGPRAQVRAHLVVRQGAELVPARWAAMTVEIGGRIAGLGIAGADGAIVAAFGYPAYPAVAPSAGARPAITWQAAIRVYWDDLAGDPPDLDLILRQLGGTALTALDKLPNTALPAQPLTLGQPLTLRTRLSATELSSSLHLKPA